MTKNVISQSKSNISKNTEKVVLGSGVQYDFYYDIPSRLISSKGWNYLEQVKKDTHVSNVLDIRSKSLLRFPWMITPASQDPIDIEIAEFVNWVINNMEGSFVEDLNEFMDGVFYGYSLSEKIWAICENGRYKDKTIIKNLKSKHPKNWKFKVNNKGNAQYVTERDSEQGKYPLSKFLYSTFGKSHKDPYGDPASIKVAFWFWLKKNGSQFWAVFLEKWGAPTTSVVVPLNPDPEAQAKIEDIIDNFESATSFQLPEGFKIELIEAKRSGSADYEGLLEFCNKEISKVIAGATLLNEEGKKGSGSYALSSSHSDILDAYVNFDAIKLSSIINEQYIRQLVDFNYDVDGNYPIFSFPSTLNKVVFAQNLAIFTQSGMKIGINWAQDYLGIPVAAPGEEILEPVDVYSQQPGESNDPGSTFAEKYHKIPAKKALKSNLREKVTFAEDNDKIISDKTDMIDNDLVSHFNVQGYNALDEIFKSVEKQLLKKLDVGKPVMNNPEFSVNVGEFQNLLTAEGTIAYTEGKLDALDQVNTKLEKLEKDPITFRDRVLPIVFADEFYDKYFKDKNIITKAEYDKIYDNLKDRYFTVAGVTKSDIEKIFLNLMLALPDGWTKEEFVKNVEAEKIRYIGTEKAISEPHITLVFHNAAMTAYTMGENELYNDPAVADLVWGYKYLVINDGRARKKHLKALNVTLPKDHPFWKYHTPPWDHKCRCGREVILVEEIESGFVLQTPESEIPSNSVIGIGWYAA